LDGAGLTVRFYNPTKASTGEFRCNWTIFWPDREQRRCVCGEDSVQALLLAMRAVHQELVLNDAYKEGRLTLYGQPDLDLPPAYHNPAETDAVESGSKE
jgi:hypothetical protein